VVGSRHAERSRVELQSSAPHRPLGCSAAQPFGILGCSVTQSSLVSQARARTDTRRERCVWVWLTLVPAPHEAFGEDGTDLVDARKVYVALGLLEQI
jgi:hypothetical protein